MRTLLMFLAISVAGHAADYLPETSAPAVTPTLLFVTHCGGPGTDGFLAVFRLWPAQPQPSGKTPRR